MEFKKQQEIDHLIMELQNLNEENQKIQQRNEDEINYLTQDLQSANAKIKRLEEEKATYQQATTSRDRNENQCKQSCCLIS